MTAHRLRRQAKSMIGEMSTSDLQIVREFLAFIARRDTNAATRELLAIPGFAKSIVRGAKDINFNRVKQSRRVRNDA